MIYTFLFVFFFLQSEFGCFLMCHLAGHAVNFDSSNRIWLAIEIRFKQSIHTFYSLDGWFVHFYYSVKYVHNLLCTCLHFTILYTYSKINKNLFNINCKGVVFLINKKNDVFVKGNFVSFFVKLLNIFILGPPPPRPKKGGR